MVFISYIYILAIESSGSHNSNYTTETGEEKKTIVYGRKRKVSLGVGYTNDINVFYFRIVFPVPSAVCGDSQPTKDTHARQWLCVCVCACFVWRGWS